MPAALVAGVTVIALVPTGPAHAADTVPEAQAPPVRTAGWAEPTDSLRTDPDVLARGVSKGETARVVVVKDTGAGLAVRETRVVGRAAAVAAIAAAQQEPGALAAGLDRRVVQAGTRHRSKGWADDRYRGRQWGMDLLRVESAWRRSTGRGVVVAVVDSGVDGRHPDLRGAVAAGVNTRRDHGDSSPATRDGSGHGTHVAGIIAARAGNGVGVVGVAPRARIMPVKVLGADGTGWTSDVVEGITWAADHGADVLNLSLVASSAGFMAPAIRYAIAKGVTVVASAGNEGTRRPRYPAAFPGVVSVGALDPSGRIADYSNRGDTIDLAAPGTNIVSTAPGGRYAMSSGTSMAAPHVAGVATLVEALDPDADAAAILFGSAVDLGEGGRDDAYGHGRVAPAAAQRLTCATVECATGARLRRAQTVRHPRRIRLHRTAFLPARTRQLMPASWQSRTSSVCRVGVRHGRPSLTAHQFGRCRVRITAPGTARLAPLAVRVTVRVTRR